MIEESDNESDKESDKESDNESDNESNKENKSIEEMFEEIINESEEEFIEDLKEAMGLNNKITTDWYDKNKFNKILTAIDSNSFNHKNKIGKLRFNDINNLVNNIKNNTISEADAKKKINKLNKIKKAEIKGKRLVNGQKTLLSLFDELLKAIFNNNSNSNNNNNNKDLSENVSENESVNENYNESENESENENEDEQYYEIKQLNNWFKTIDETKSLEEQIKLLKEIEFLDEYWHMGYYHGHNKLNLKIFQAKAAYLLNDLDESLFKKIFGHEFAALADTVINTIGKEENKIIIYNIKNNRQKMFEPDEYSKSVIQPTHKRGDLNDAVKIILNFNEVLTLDLT